MITLDSDTRLPRDTAKKLIGKIAHPLNQPVVDPASGKVSRGFSVLQPRVTPSLPSVDDTSTFQSVYSTQRGLTPYAVAISDVYQDLRSRIVQRQAFTIDVLEAARGPIGEHRPRMTCWKATTPDPAWSPTSRWSRNTRPARSTPNGSTVGCGATGSCCRGSSAATPDWMASASGRCSTTCGAPWCPSSRYSGSSWRWWRRLGRWRPAGWCCCSRNCCCPH